ncbi:uncharacterized protein LOC121385042 [Gigantopelta aegis]|uniref:uncharacterized protein LOC121385042 n=1 Tax=Gigantopelta aegis TaxID=1735272 RepID=UPI001B88E28F|nr:uncharacterized protein LOC121385042 [Gigantopelta aegis]
MNHSRTMKTEKPKTLPPSKTLSKMEEGVSLSDMLMEASHRSPSQLDISPPTEASALLEAAKVLNLQDKLSPNIVFLTDCRSLLQSLQTHCGEHILLNIRRELQDMSKRTDIILQWIPSHCGVPGNEEADRLSKIGSKLQQVSQPTSYLEVKTIIKNRFNTNWKIRMEVEKEDNLESLDRTQQVIIFRIRTGHCRLLSHLYRLRLAHTDECPCGTDAQTSEHILQSCPSYSTLRQET